MGELPTIARLSELYCVAWRDQQNCRKCHAREAFWYDQHQETRCHPYVGSASCWCFVVPNVKNTVAARFATFDQRCFNWDYCSHQITSHTFFSSQSVGRHDLVGEGFIKASNKFDTGTPTQKLLIPTTWVTSTVPCQMTRMLVMRQDCEIKEHFEKNEKIVICFHWSPATFKTMWQGTTL